MRPAVFLDRDGVINRAPVRAGRPYSPASLRTVEILPGVPEALATLKARGYWLIVVTNQPDVARGITTRESVDGIHDCLKSKLNLDAVFACFHDCIDRCDCRKPKAGLIFQAAADYDIDLPNSFMIGDRWRDVEAGTLAGCRTFFIDYGYCERQPASVDFQVRSLMEATRIILEQRDTR